MRTLNSAKRSCADTVCREHSFPSSSRHLCSIFTSKPKIIVLLWLKSPWHDCFFVVQVLQQQWQLQNMTLTGQTQRLACESLAPDSLAHETTRGKVQGCNCMNNTTCLCDKTKTDTRATFLSQTIHRLHAYRIGKTISGIDFWYCVNIPHFGMY